MIKAIICTMALLAAAAFQNTHAQADITPEEARAIAKEAYIYANPLVDSYRILYSYFVDEEDPDYKAPWPRRNRLFRAAGVPNTTSIVAGSIQSP